MDVDKLRLQFEVAIKDELLRFERTRVELLECKLEKASLEYENSRLRDRVKELERGIGGESTPVGTPVGEFRRTSIEDEDEGRKRSCLKSGTKTVVEAVKKRAKSDSAWTRDSPRRDHDASFDDEEGEKMEDEECMLSNHAIIKLQKTSHAKMRRDGTVYFQPSGLKFCHRCKRTSADVAFAESRTSVCNPCDARVKELTARKTPSEKLKGQPKSTTTNPDEKLKMNEIQRRIMWNKMLHAIEAGDVQKCEAVRKECVRLAEKYTHALCWDREVFVMCAWRSKNPIEVANWALMNNASRERNCAEIDALRTAVERVPESFNTKEDGTHISAREVLEHFVRCGFNVTCDILHTACAFGSLECIKYLKKAVPCCDFERWNDFKRPDGEANQIMHVAAQEGHVEVLKYLYDNDCDFSVEDAEQCLDLAENRKPKRAENSALVIEWIKQTDEWRESQVPNVNESEV